MSSRHAHTPRNRSRRIARRSAARAGATGAGRPALAVVALGCALAWLGAIAPVASATDGHGIYGGVTDKVVTLAGFCLMGFFVVFIFTMSMLQGRLERRKEARKAAKASLPAARWRGGW